MHPQWATWLRILLYIHIACGITGFVCAPVALLTAKGGRTHRSWGKVYFWAMAGVAVTALTLSLALPIYFLAMVSVFSFYAAFSAYRILYLKDLYKRGRPRPYDWAAALLTIASSLVLFLMGFFAPYVMHVGVITIAGFTVSIVSIVFGYLGMSIGYKSIQQFRNLPKERTFWWFSHLQGMIASYIAAMTAFSAVNLSRWFGAAWWVWLWPTIIGVPAIALWTRYYEKKFSGARPKAAA
jgi:hypothetical protein